MQQVFWNIVTGSTIKNLSLESIKKMKTLFPNNDSIKQFVIKNSSVDNERKNIFQENQQLTELRDWLVPMLMNGQITVGKAEEKVELNMAAEPKIKY